MKMGIVVGLAAAAAYYVFELEQAASNISFEFKGIQLDGANTNLVQIGLLVTLRVFNPGNVNLKFDKYVGNVIINGQPIAALNMQGAGAGIKIPSNGYSDITFPVWISTAGLIGNIANLVKNGLPQNISLDGKLQFAGILLPVTKTIQLNGATPVSGICSVC